MSKKANLLFWLVILTLVAMAGSVTASDVDTLEFYIKDIDRPWTETITVTMDALHDELLTVQMDTQRICYHEFGGLRGIRVLKGTFLELEYNYSGGGNVFGATIFKLLCVKSFKFFEALDAMTYYGYNLPLQYRECDSLKLEAGRDWWEYEYSLRAADSTFAMQVIQHHQIASECDPELDVDTTDTLHLAFSKEFGVFYNRIDTLSGCFHFPKPNENATIPCENRTGVVAPGVHMGVFDATSYFVDGCWCSKDDAVHVYCGRGDTCPSSK